MKNVKFYLSYLAAFTLIFSSCSKDESAAVDSNSELATLSFGAIVENLAAKSSNRQSSIADMPACTDDTASYVEIVLNQGETSVVGTIEEPYRVDLVSGQIFTEEDEALELTPGTYTLEHFSVYNADGELIWLAPKGGVLAQFVDNPLPLTINLGAGVKKYVDVSVLCYDNRDVNQYGYLFFELDVHRAFTMCVFANYCDEDGRHYPARYSVDVRVDGTLLYSNARNTVGINSDGDFYANPLCGALPDLSQFGDDEDYIEITYTLLDWDANYGEAPDMVITKTYSRSDIESMFVGDDQVDYEHIRFGCDE